MLHSKILGIGAYVPEKVVTNYDLEKMMDTSNEWIVERTGIHERRWIDKPMGASDLAAPASLEAIEMAGLKKEDIDMIIFATLNPDYSMPGSSSLLQAKLELYGIPTLDIRVQCSGFVYGLAMADSFVKSGAFKNILLVGSEVQSVGLNLTTEGRDLAVLFGDGAGAAVITRSNDDSRILSYHLGGDGRYVKELWCEAPVGFQSPRISKEMINEGRHFPKMNGRNVFKHAITIFPKIVKIAMESQGWNINDVDLIIPHQANLRITEALAKSLNVGLDKVYSNIHKYGNTTAASIPLALYDALKEGKIKKGSNLILAAFGSGFTWGSVAVRW